MFKSLALIAVAQQGKPVEDWALDPYADKGGAASNKKTRVTRDLHRPSNAQVGTTEGESKGRGNQISRDQLTNYLCIHIPRSSEIRHHHSAISAREERNGF